MYYFSGTSKKYIDAQQFCARVNAYLVEFYNLLQYREVCSAGGREFQTRPDQRFLLQSTRVGFSDIAGIY